MNVVIVTDNQYAQYAAVMLTSLYENTKQSNRIVLYVIFHDLSMSNQSQLLDLVKYYKSEINFIEVKDNFGDFHEGAYVSRAAYLKINIPQYLPQSEQKALYLDGDIIVTSDILQFNDINLGDHYLAAVSDDNMFLADDLGISVESYFNSGVILFNLEKWRDNDISSQIYEYVMSPYNKRNTCDQDAFNFVLWDKWLKLDRRYNYLLTNHIDIEEPIVFHYAARDKPWHVLYSGKYKELFLDYEKKCIWQDYSRQDMDLLMNHKIVIYGASTAGVSAYEQLKEHSLEIQFFVDGDEQKHNTMKMNKPIYEISVLKSLENSYVVIVPSTSYYDEMRVALESYSFYPLRICNKIFLKDELGVV
ncbi:glycosyltransferase family 8 protein [Paenibacillus endoradicis]|uniref:glycosyltransferase family 8 protein n=1 Tax=Paenibacillus endoradicis TaxID=2972487 RepID=UPI002158A7B4|nr:glycosyltransferase family 8 protein [Paenibacillus endoradicis]MCR8660520.1 glycosyltransferase family 8 protein [Paenibacillus endoradicis]